MPQLPALDDFPYIPQDEDSFACVPACLEMICEYLALRKGREEIEEEIGYSVDDGTPFQNVFLLSGVRTVLIPSLQEAANQIERRLPVIADLRIDDNQVLGYAGEGPFDHAVVIVGVESAEVRFFDPLSWVRIGTGGPTSCDRAAFERAWLSGWVLTSHGGV
jgi:ABC-type bacteriocin/lantibiotic exporter with double-glycine peptidase domain